jgi:nucleotide-binding universal stress UspA family protein
MTQKEAEARAIRLSETLESLKAIKQDGSASRSQHPSVSARRATAPVIVVGLDGSPTSWDAFSWAAGEATRSNGSLVAVYITPMVNPVALYGEVSGYAAVEQARDEVAAELKEEAEGRARDLGVRLRFVRERGDPAPAIVRFAKSVRADLIVVGRSAKMLHHLAGSLGRRLVTRNDAPVIVVVP